MNKGYKYKLLPTIEQHKLLKNHMFTAVQCYNILLSLKQQELENNKTRKDKGLKPEYHSFKYLDDTVKTIIKERKLTYNTKILQQERIRFNQNYNSQLKKLKSGNDIGFLKFKKYSHNSYQSFQTTKEQYKLLNYINPNTNKINNKYKILRLFNESIKIRWTRDLPSISTSITLSYDGINFYIVFNIIEDNNPFIDLKDINETNSIGLDMNNSSIDIGNKKFHKSYKIKDLKGEQHLIDKIKRLNKQQSKRLEKVKKHNKGLRKDSDKRIKLSSNYYKTQVKLNKCHKTLSNKRNDRIHQMTNTILNFIKDNGIKNVIIENLNVKYMTSKKNINKDIGKQKSKSMKKNILNISYTSFLGILTYKCVQNGIYVNNVNPKNTSKQCSSCLTIKKELNIKDRIYKCDVCGLEIKRDYNACLNIMNKYFKTIETMGLAS